MDLLGQLQSFVSTVDEGSFSGAARRLKVSQPAISQQISSLEAHTGKELLYRTSKGIKITRAGELVYSHARTMLDQSRLLHADLDALDTGIAGRLRISVGFLMGPLIVSPVLMELRQDYPQLDIISVMEDHLVDVVKQGYDLALRVGNLGGTDGFARRIGTVKTVLFASKNYLDRVGRPSSPKDLETMDFVQYREHRVKSGLVVINEGTTQKIAVNVSFTANNPQDLISAVQHGMGFSRGPLFVLEDKLASGEIETILCDFEVPDKPVYIVYPSRSALSRQSRLFIEKLMQKLEKFSHISISQNAIEEFYSDHQDMMPT